MVKVAFAVFVFMHGLVHLWFVVLSQELIEVTPEMGWTPRSWLLTPLLGLPATRWIATAVSVALAGAFAAGSLGLLARAPWWRVVMSVAGLVSALLILLYWDGGTTRLVEKGLVGFLISAMLLVVLQVLSWPPGAA